MKALHKLYHPASQADATPKGAIAYLDAAEIPAALAAAIEATDSVLDIGPGLRPMSFFVPQTHIMLEGFKDYIPLLQKRFSSQPGAVFINAEAQAALPLLADKSVDSVIMLDVIEHMTRRTAKEVLKHCERIARRQIIVETPYGYVEQRYRKGEVDGWGFAYNALQNHKSGWDESDFQDGWQLFICRQFGFHQQSGKPYGLMYAIKNLGEERHRLPGKLLFVSAKVPPMQDQNWQFIRDVFQTIDANDAVILTDDTLSAYIMTYFDIVLFARERLAPLHLTASGSRAINYVDLEQRIRHMALYDMGYEALAKRMDHIIEQHGITHLLFTDESSTLCQNLKQFAAKNNLPALCLTLDSARECSPAQIKENITGFMRQSRREHG